MLAVQPKQIFNEYMTEFGTESKTEPFEDLGFSPAVSMDGLKSVLLRRKKAVEYFNENAKRMTPDSRIPGDPLGHLELSDMRDSHERILETLDLVLPVSDGRSWADIVAAQTADGKDLLAEKQRSDAGA